MKPLRLSDLAKKLGLTYTQTDVLFDTISTDTRTLEVDDVFLAIVGERFNGHHFIEEALNKGAKALIVSEAIPQSLPIPYLQVSDTLIAYAELAKIKRMMFSKPVIGLTGSCGKTTTRAMIAQILSLSHRVLLPQKNYNNEVGVPATLMQLDQHYDYAVIEMGATKAGDIRYLTDIVRPDMSLLTNAGPSHLKTFGSLDGVAHAKGEIFKYLQPNGMAVINTDDIYAPYWLSLLTTQKVTTFAKSSAADVRCTYVGIGDEYTRFTMETPKGTFTVDLPVLGEHNVVNALAATACCLALRIPIEQIIKGLSQFSPVERRLNIMKGLNGVTILDDSYNANPVSVKAALSVLSQQKSKEKVFVLGDMRELGIDEQSMHQEIGRLARKLGISTILGIGELAKLAIDSFGGKAKHYQDRGLLIQDLKKMLNDKTTVLIKGSLVMQMDEFTKALTGTQ